MGTGVRTGGLLVPALAALAFVFLLGFFAFRLYDYHRSVTDWSRRELDSRAAHAALTLAEPLRTLDLAAVRAFGEQCRRDELRLRIVHGAAADGRFETGAGFFDTGAEEGPCLFGRATAGDYRIGLGRSLAAIERPFRRALTVVVLAALLGTVGMSLFFITVWRQRLRIRELARLERFRSDFIADVSHELKTPLTGIVMAADMLGDVVRGNPAAERLGAMMKGEAKRLERLAQSVQELARLEHEEDVFRPEATDLNGLIAACVDQHRAAAEKAGVRLASQTVADARATVDPALLSMAVSNLIGNAIRHSGSPEVDVRLQREKGGWAIEVEDHGIGLPPEAAVRVFERFYRVDPARAKESGGSGLGLAIVSRIAALHGGEATCRPAVPAGTVFRLVFRG